jgi:hypothetical protein
MIRRIACLAFALTVAGCHFPPSITEMMRTLPRDAPVPVSPERATLVFMNTVGWGAGVWVASAKGTFVTVASDGLSFVQVKPGHHTYFAFAALDEGVMMEMDVAANRVYYIETFTTPGFMRPEVHFKAVKRKMKSWVKKDEWMQMTPRQPRPEAQQLWANWMEPEHMQEIVADAMKRRSKDNAVEMDEHTIRLEDGEAMAAAPAGKVEDAPPPVE